ncbi:MAG: hypothetical protein GXO69_00080 [Acidobacteria bacterium]|nr:hypothetical protein [Acidobacteriota bacterium]
MPQQASCIQKRGIGVFLTMLFLGAALSPCFSAETVVVPQEEVEMLKDYGNASCSVRVYNQPEQQGAVPV